MSLETHIAGVEDALLEGLTFDNRPTASYVTKRSQCTFAPQSGALFSPSGIRLMRFNLADQDGFLDGGTVRLAFTLRNKGAGKLEPIVASPASIFQRMRLISQGSAVLEDISEYGQVHEMFSQLLPSARLYNDVAETWGGQSGVKMIGTDHTNNRTLEEPYTPSYIPTGKSKIVMCQLMSAVLSQRKMIPLSALPIVLELEIGNVNDAFAGAANDWVIENPRLLADVLQLDNTLANSYAKHLQEGNNLPIACHGLYTIRSAVPQGNQASFSLAIQRGFGQLATVYMFFKGTGDKMNVFRHPMYGADASSNPTDESDTLTYNMQLGKDRYPQFDVQSAQEAFYRLRNACLMHNGTDSFAISPHQYVNDKFIMAQNLEKAAGEAAYTGVNTKSGSLMTINFKNLGDGVKEVYCILHYDYVINVSAAGAEVLE